MAGLFGKVGAVVKGGSSGLVLTLSLSTVWVEFASGWVGELALALCLTIDPLDKGRGLRVFNGGLDGAVVWFELAFMLDRGDWEPILPGRASFVNEVEVERTLVIGRRMTN